jgi:transposase-like protein
MMSERWLQVAYTRILDKAGQTVDFRLSSRRDVAAAKAVFPKAIRHEGQPPHTIALDGYAASHRAVLEMREEAPVHCVV